jgi:methyl-accepting chemotaxis protein
MNGSYSGQFEQLATALNSSLSTLRKTVTQISQSSHSVTRSATEIATGNFQLQKRTEGQAQSLQETASSIEEITATISQNAANSREADKLAASARETAEKGGEVVGRAVTSMAEINASSKKIADIIGVIDEIAFQTNLLALNAAVEAARAGEQGRGFAVVATEVRNLAQRSAAAAKEIKSLISESVEKVKQGTHLVDESGSTLKEIVQAVKRVSDIVGEISAASQEQAAGVEQINKAITAIDEVTQQNAAQVEEATAAAESLKRQAGDLSKMVNKFDLGDRPSGAAEDPDGGGEAEDPQPGPTRAAKPERATKKARKRGNKPPASDTGGAGDEDQDWEDF